MIEITAEQQAYYIQTVQSLKGSERRIFMASVVQMLGRGGQRYVEKVFGWNRRTVRKGMLELVSGIPQIDQFALRGRKRVEARLPSLLADLQAIIGSPNSSTAASSPSRATSRLSAAKVRQQLIEQKGYADESLPCTATIRKLMRELFPISPKQ